MDAQAELTAALARDLDGTFERMVLSQQDRLYSIALRMLGDPRDAEEVAQDAFVRAYRALAGYEPDRIRDLQLRAWLATIVLNLCRNRLRRHGLPQVPLDGAMGDDAPASPAAGLAATDPRGSPHEAIVRRESAGRWAALLVILPLHYRSAVILRHVDGLSYAEMSVALGRPEGTLKAQVHRGLALLRGAAERTDLVERQEMTA
jgi:RNA polymerase sigma-70 factor (ECF subfamily)